MSTILITGATDGVGRITADILTRQGHEVLLHGRSEEKLKQTLNELLMVPSARVESFCADLASLAEVRKMAETIGERHPKLDALINNAGVGPGAVGASRQVSSDGHELRFQVNYLAPALLTQLLLPSLRAAHGRVVHVASAAQEVLEFDDLMCERNYSGMKAYACSKLAILMNALTLADQERDNETGVTANALDPGSMLNTKMVREAMGQGYGRAEDGAEAQAFLATNDTVSGITGRYFLQKEQAQPHPQALDERARLTLSVATEALLQVAIG